MVTLDDAIGGLLHTDPTVRATAAQQLGEIGGPVAAMALLEMVTLRLGRANQEEIELEPIKAALVMIGDEVVPYLIASLQNGRPRPLHFYFDVLFGIGSPPVIEGLIEIFREYSFDTQTIKRIKRWFLHHANTIFLTVARFRHDSVHHVRKLVVEVLAQVTDERVIPFLGDVIAHDADLFLRQEAVTGLGHFHTPEATRLLEKALQDSDSWVRQCAHHALHHAQQAPIAPHNSPASE